MFFWNLDTIQSPLFKVEGNCPFVVSPMTLVFSSLHFLPPRSEPPSFTFTSSLPSLCYLCDLIFLSLDTTRSIAMFMLLSMLFYMVIHNSFLFEIVCSKNILNDIFIYYFKVILHGRKSGVWRNIRQLPALFTTYPTNASQTSSSIRTTEILLLVLTLN